MLTSLLDNDLYKLTMQRAVWERYPDAEVTYRFISRDPGRRFGAKFAECLRDRIPDLADLRLSVDEREWLERYDFFSPGYLDFLERYRFDPREVTVTLDPEEGLDLEVKGNWARTILWEVPLLALISETYHGLNDPVWPHDADAYCRRSMEKGKALSEAGCVFADFGTRRRRSYHLQDAMMEGFLKLPECVEGGRSTFAGTSNVHLAYRWGVDPIGTMAHEWIMGHQGLFGIREANRKALETWLEVFEGKLGIALSDTYTSTYFRHDFGPDLAARYEGVRQDSGSPFRFTDAFLAHYARLGLDASQKKFVFSDGLTVAKAQEIARYVGERAKPVFGIGTHLTNDLSEQPPLDIVIKMLSINGKPVVKITDDPSKATGEPEALKHAIHVVEETTGMSLEGSASER